MIRPTRMGFDPRDPDLSLETGIEASRLAFEPKWGWTYREGGEIPPMVSKVVVRPATIQSSFGNNGWSKKK